MQDIANNWVGMIKSGRDPLYGTLKFAVYNNEWMNWANFLYDDANLGKLKITLIIFGWLWLEMGMGLQLLDEWMNLADFLHAYTYPGKLKVTLIVTGWACSNMDIAF